jgi:hypothetical protein
LNLSYSVASSGLIRRFLSWLYMDFRVIHFIQLFSRIFNLGV